MKRGAGWLAALMAVGACSATAGRPPAAVPPTPAPPAQPGPSTTVGVPRAACPPAPEVAGWPLARLAAQVIAAPVLGASPAALAVANRAGVGAVLLLGSLPPAAELARDLRPVAGGGRGSSWVMVDEEGGGVSRLGGDVATLPWPRTMAATMTTAEVRTLAATVGAQMRALGVAVDLAPVLDLDAGRSLSATDPDGPRSWSPDPATASAYGDAFAAGLESAGVVAVAKHFPGLGGASGNSDYGSSATQPIALLQARGLDPFRAAVAAGVPAVMVTVASVPGLSARPAALEPAVVEGLLRGQLGFGGVVMTDSLSAPAVAAAGYDVPRAAVAALAAGADLVLFGSTLTPADVAALSPASLGPEIGAVEHAIEAAVTSGQLPRARLDAAVSRILAAKEAQARPGC